MERSRLKHHRLVVVVLFLGAPSLFGSETLAAELKPETVRAWDNYIRLTEIRIESELHSPDGFLARDFLDQRPSPECRKRFLSEDICVLKMETLTETGRRFHVPDGLIHHWLGSVFIPAVGLGEVLSWVQHVDEHQRYFDDVEESRLLRREADESQILLRLNRKKLVTVHYATEHRVKVLWLGPDRVASRSIATKIAEIAEPGTPKEREKPEGRDSGFLWRLNSYWRYRQVDGGVLVECESISLSRSIPAAVKWLVGGYLDSVPRESMASTLGSLRKGVSSQVVSSQGAPTWER